MGARIVTRAKRFGRKHPSNKAVRVVASRVNRRDPSGSDLPLCPKNIIIIIPMWSMMMRRRRRMPCLHLWLNGIFEQR